MKDIYKYEMLQLEITVILQDIIVLQNLQRQRQSETIYGEEQDDVLLWNGESVSYSVSDDYIDDVVYVKYKEIDHIQNHDLIRLDKKKLVRLYTLFHKIKSRRLAKKKKIKKG